MKTMTVALSIALLSMTVGCANRDNPATAEHDGPSVAEIAEFTEAQDQFKTRAAFENAMRFRIGTAFEDGVFSVEVQPESGSPRTLTSAAHRQYEWATYLPTPPIPGFVNREWFLAENRHDGRTILYTAVEWDEGNPVDYLSVGWWLHYPPSVPTDDYQAAERGVFIDGPELDLSTPPEMPVSGTAIYTGGTGGLYEYFYGSAWGELQGESQYVEFSAPIKLEANFSEGMIVGCIGCTGDIEAETLHLWPAVAWRGPDPQALPTDYEVHLGPAPFNPDGTFENAAVSVRHPERTVTQSEGVWGGQFSNVPDRDGNPRRVVGYGGVRFDESDGSIGSFESIFSTLTPTTVNSRQSETPRTP